MTTGDSFATIITNFHNLFLGWGTEVTGELGLIPWLELEAETGSENRG